MYQTANQRTHWQKKLTVYMCMCVWMMMVIFNHNFTHMRRTNQLGILMSQPQISIVTKLCKMPNYFQKKYYLNYKKDKVIEKRKEIEWKMQNLLGNVSGGMQERISNVAEVIVANKEGTKVANISIPANFEETSKITGQQVGQAGNYFIERRPAIEYTEEDLWYLANGIYSEAGICSDMECYRCGQVMLDRMLDQTGRFPQNTMKGILLAPGQFGCVNGPAWMHGPNEREIKIAIDLFNGARVFPEDIVWFNNTHDYGYLYCRPEYHCFSGYINWNGMNFPEESNTIPETSKTILEVQEESTTMIEEEIIEDEINEDVTEESTIPEEDNTTK